MPSVTTHGKPYVMQALDIQSLRINTLQGSFKKFAD